MKILNSLPLLLCIFALTLAGCATTQNSNAQKDDRPLAERISMGMSKEEVVKAIGEPDGRATRSSGEETWTYSDHAKMFIPFYAISGGKFENLTINFDSTGKVKDWALGKQGIY